MKKVLYIISIFATLTIQAQDATKAKALIDKVTANIKTYKNIELDFSYSLDNPKEKVKQDSKGKVTLSGEQYILDFMGVKKLCDGKKIYTISTEDEEITIAKIETDDAVTPAKMLTSFSKGFKYDWDIVQNVKGKKIQYVKLTPTGKDDRKNIYVGIDSKTNMIYNTIAVNKNGTKVTLTVNSFKTNQALSKNHFTFVQSKYPNYYINKLD